MIGITSFGGYIPRLRMDRMTIYQRSGWFAPATIMVAQGERSFCNWDEDTLTMAVEAARDCLTGVDRVDIDGVFLCSTTPPFADRLNAGIVQTTLNLRADIDTRDLASTLRAGTGGLITALDTVKAGEAGQILVLASDKRQAKAAYFYEMWFGDGAAAVTVGDDKVVAEYLGSHSLSYDFVDHYRGSGHKFDYMWEERWVRDEGYSKFIPEAVEGLFAKLDITMEDVDKLVFPCFFKAEHRKIAHKLGASPDKVVDNLHDVCGETGAAHPLVMLSHTLEDAKPGERILLCGFGQGCDAMLFQVTDEIANLPARRGIRGSLADKSTVDNYEKFLKFRELWQVETGIRAEAPTQTAMTVLWRKRKMILGLMGGVCRSCGTRQWPKTDICVKPGCRAYQSQDDTEFADTQATIRTFTGDLLAVSVDPPAVYGMVDFEGGGRMMADFTDCTHDEVWVGQPARLVLRRRYKDEERGFSGYFWKALPDRTAERPGANKGAADGIRYDGRVAIVTGAGAGLGRSYALELAARGAKVVVNDLGGARDGSGDGSARAADHVVDEIIAAGGEAVASYDSVSTVEGGQAIIDKALDAYGQVDILVNNAGILRDKSLVKIEPADWDAVLSVHLDAVYNVTRPAFTHMKEQGFGRIVLTTSAAGLFGNFGQTNYSAAKLGIVGFMNTLKVEGRKYDVMVNTVAPIAATRLTEDILPPHLLEALVPEHVVPLTLYLCWEGLKDTGQILNAGAGFFSRAAMLSAPGVQVGDGETPPTPEQIQRRWAEIDSLEGGAEYFDAMEQLMPLLTGQPPAGAASKEEPADDGAFQADKAAGVDVVFQFKLTGDGGGDWYATIVDQTCTIAAGAHDRPTTTIIMSAPDFIDLITGKLNAMAAYTGGQLRIEGDLMKSQLIEKIFKF